MDQHPPSPAAPGPASGANHDMTQTVGEMRRHLSHLERLLRDPATPAPAGDSGPPAASAPAGAPRGEQRWPVATVVVVAVALQLILPQRLDIGSQWLLPGLEVALLVGLTAANPRRIDRSSTALKAASVGLIALISLANAWSSLELIRGLVDGTYGQTAGPLLAGGASIYLTNIIVFALWFWEWDRGGAAARAAGKGNADFLFPQMARPGNTWTPTFLDYLYVSYTNAAAFSPTDTMPLSHWAKMLMLVQSAVALTTVALVVSRAVNVLH